MTQTQPDRSLADSFIPLAGWMAASMGVLVLAAFGPRLWASQRSDNAGLGLEIVAAGQVVLAAFGWPIWTRSAAACIAVLVAEPVWMLLAAQVGVRSNAETLQLGWKVLAVLAVLVAIRVSTPRRATGGAWAVVVAMAIGLPSLIYLSGNE